MIACFLSNISAKYYKNPSMLSRVIAKNVGDVFFETQCIYIHKNAEVGNESEAKKELLSNSVGWPTFSSSDEVPGTL